MSTTRNELPTVSRALVSIGPKRAEYRSVPVPGDLGDGGLGRVLAAGVCGSDLTLFQGGAIAERLWPLVLGHETVVRVEKSSPTLTERWGVAAGNRVFVEEFIPCGWCEACRSGDYQICPRTDFRSERFLRYGRTSLETGPGLWGGFADYLYLHPNARLHQVPDDVASHLAVLATPLANGLRWIGTIAGTQPGDNVVILGPGAHGLGCVLAAREIGADDVILVGRSSDRRRLSVGASLGADSVLHSDRDDVKADVNRRTGGRGAQVVVDVTGSPDAATLAVQLAARGGRVVLAGGGPGPAVGFPVDLVTNRELRIFGVRGHSGHDIARAMALIGSGKHRLELMSTTPTPLADGGSLLTQLCADDADHAAHHVLVPGCGTDGRAGDEQSQRPELGGVST